MSFEIPLGEWIEAVVEWCNVHLAAFFDGLSLVIGSLIGAVESALLYPPALALAAVIVVLAAWRVGWRFAAFAVAALALVLGMDLWAETMITLALIIASTAISLILGLPLGIAAARSDLVQTMVRPLMDLMQTLPPFVYLIPAAMFFGLGKVPGAIATIIFAMPPAVRLTALGIRNVDAEIVEAGLAFGCTARQLLMRVQLPMALPSIMAGINQTVMLALSMVVIAAMIGAGGLGNEVLRGIQRLEIGVGFEGGIGVVVLAILLDRITQSFGTGEPPHTLLARWLRALLAREA
ncbi:MAG: ABC transporter permease [Pseudomonadota bacterium]